jgi:hypothetical protein
MINRMDDYLPAAEPKSRGEAGGLAFGVWPPDWKAAVREAEGWIIKHPGVSLASAFVVGAALAWWIKRK